MTDSLSSFCFQGGMQMNIVTYSLFAYGLTIALSFAVTGIIVLTDRVFTKNGE